MTAPLLGRRCAADWRQVSHGLYLPPSSPSSRSSLSSLHSSDGGRRSEQARRALRLDDLPAWALVLPPDGCFTHLSAAALYGWWLPELPDRVPVFAATRERDARRRRDGLFLVRLSTAVQPRRSPGGLGLLADQPADVLLAAARHLGVLDLTVMLDSALRRRDVTRADVELVCGRPRPGVRALRAALELADPRSESPGETLLRLLHVMCGIEVDPQYVVRDLGGAFVARADLRVRGTQSLHEYDGANHLQRSQQRRDRARDRRLERVGWVRRGYVREDVLHTPYDIVRDACDDLGRPVPTDAVRRWLELVRASMYSPASRARAGHAWERAWRRP